MKDPARAFGTLIATALAASALLALPPLITLFPGAFQHALHGYDAVAAVCAAALYRIGAELPPLGVIVLGLAAASLGLGVVKAFCTLLRTQRVLAAQRAVATPPRLASVTRAVAMNIVVSCFDDPRPIAYCRGFVTPRIWISSGALARLRPRELEAVLHHEAAHAHAHDPLRILIARVVADILFPLPLIRSLALRFEVAKELTADRATVERQRTPRHLASALIAMGREPHLESVAIGGWSLAHVRVDQLCGASGHELLPRPPRRVYVITLAALTVAIFLTLGQAARANLVPAAIVETLAGPMDDAQMHSCPLPADGPLL